jgi:anti-sigma factor RsiW
MDCTHAQDFLLDEVDGLLEPAARPELLRHLAGCESCRAFAGLQRQLDAELRKGIPALSLDARFRRALEPRLCKEPWPEWLPDVAYLAGAAFATAATVVALPLPAASTWWIGGALAALGFVVHSVVASTFSDLDAAGDF